MVQMLVNNFFWTFTFAVPVVVLTYTYRWWCFEHLKRVVHNIFKVADNDAPAARPETTVSARDKANEEYRSLWLGDDCRYCDGDFAEDLETAWNYLQIVMITAGVLVVLFLLLYVLCRCGDRPDCEDYETLSGESWKTRWPYCNNTYHMFSFIRSIGMPSNVWNVFDHVKILNHKNLQITSMSIEHSKYCT